VEKLLRGISSAPAFGRTVEEWNSAVRQLFGPYVRRKSILGRDRESFQSELVNLAEIEAVPDYSDLLRRILRKYRSIIRADHDAALDFLVRCFESTSRADEHWMSLFMTQPLIAQSSRLYDRVFQKFAILESILEGCYKLQLRVVFGFAARDRTGQFPSDIGGRDFGTLLSFIAEAYSSRAHLLIDDPVYGIPVNQWRNIAAHKTFTIISGDAIEIRYGRSTPRSQYIGLTTLDQIINWAKRCLATARIANMIIFLEYMTELRTIGLPTVPLRLESYLVTLCHNLAIVGMECTGYAEEHDAFVLSLRDGLGRAFRDAIIHASQVLDQISAVLEADPTTRGRFQSSVVRLLDERGACLASALIKVDDAIAFTDGKLSLKNRLERTKFDFSQQS
jgi:hypothetical protein